VGAVGVEFNQTLTAGGGTEPYFWSVVSNSLPDGLTLIETNGLITGVPKMVTTNNFTVSVIDGGCQMAEKDFSLAIMTPFEAWQVQYFRCTDCPEATPYADPLGKGISNTNQFLLGLNPTNPASVFRITALTRQGNTNVITWSTAGVRTNVVQGAAGIGNGYNFSDISGGITISVVGDTITNHTDPSGTNAFYRIRLGP
jgi:hypothetical protein